MTLCERVDREKLMNYWPESEEIRVAFERFLNEREGERERFLVDSSNTFFSMRVEKTVLVRSGNDVH